MKTCYKVKIIFVLLLVLMIIGCSNGTTGSGGRSRGGSSFGGSGFGGSGGGSGGGGSGGGSSVSQTSTFSGKDADGNTYSLRITSSTSVVSRAVRAGDRYVLTKNPGNKKSEGSVQSVSGGNLTLKPDNGSAFSASTSGENLTISATITYNDGTKETVNITPLEGNVTIKLNEQIAEELYLDY